jgi:HlyD family secretion protein
MNQDIFRKKSLENLSSPTQLDELIENVPSKGWLALISMATIVIATILWSIYGYIPTKVKGDGIILKSSGLAKIYSTTSGMVDEVFIKHNDIIKKDQLIATVSHPDKLLSIQTQEEQLEKLQDKYKKSELKNKRDLDLFFGAIQRDKEEINSKIKTLKLKMKNTQEKSNVYSKLFDKGLITKESLLDIKDLIIKYKNEIKHLKSTLIGKNIEAFKKKKDLESSLDQVYKEVVLAKTKLRSLEKSLTLVSEIRSSFDGAVFQVPISRGSIVRNGTTIAEIEKTGAKNDLEAVFFVPATQGKLIEKTFKAHISPSTVKKEEYGFIESTISQVSSYPATKDAMMNILNNQQLVDSFFKNGPPIIVYAKLIKNKDTYSGFKWSSPKGPTVHITSGTICNVEVTVKKQAPITLAIPILKNTIGL